MERIAYLALQGDVFGYKAAYYQGIFGQKPQRCTLLHIVALLYFFLHNDSGGRGIEVALGYLDFGRRQLLLGDAYLHFGSVQLVLGVFVLDGRGMRTLEQVLVASLIALGNLIVQMCLAQGLFVDFLIGQPCGLVYAEQMLPFGHAAPCYKCRVRYLAFGLADERKHVGGFYLPTYTVRGHGLLWLYIGGLHHKSYGLLFGGNLLGYGLCISVKSAGNQYKYSQKQERGK